MSAMGPAVLRPSPIPRPHEARREKIGTMDCHKHWARRVWQLHSSKLCQEVQRQQAQALQDPFGVTPQFWALSPSAGKAQECLLLCVLLLLLLYLSVALMMCVCVYIYIHIHTSYEHHYITFIWNVTQKWMGGGVMKKCNWYSWEYVNKYRQPLNKQQWLSLL